MLKKLKIDKKLLKYLDVSVIIVLILIVAFATLNIFSATQPLARDFVSYKYVKIQLMWLSVGLIIMYLAIVFDYTIIGNYAGLLYWGSVLILIFTKVSSKKVFGQANWVQIGGVQLFQPSEFAKLALVIMLAKKIEDMDGNINTFKSFMVIAFYTAVPLALIFPDMGLTMIIFYTVLGIVFIGGLDLKVISGGLATLIAGIGLVWNTNLLPPYQKLRLTSFLNPKLDPSGNSYQLIQSKIAIGSGGVFGKGFLHGTRVAGGYVPFAFTDFIFAVVCEEWGLIGATMLFLMYGILVYKFIKIARNAKDTFGSLLCVGIISSFLYSVIQNAGMTIGIMPISGITLPFMSYGGSAMLTGFLSVGLILNVGMRKKKINF